MKRYKRVLAVIGALLLVPILAIAGIGYATFHGLSAIEDALSPFGVHFAEMPLTPARIVQALHAAGAYGKLTAA